MNIRPPQWPLGKVGHEFAPPDVPKCGFLNEFCKEEQGAKTHLHVQLKFDANVSGPM